MEYLTSLELSKKWDISQRRIILLAKSGRIAGAKKLGKNWVFLYNSEKPTDERFKTNKKLKDSNFFRYPILDFREEDCFFPPLSNEEKILKSSVFAFHKCEFKEAKELLGNLCENAKNIYIKIYAFYTACMIDIHLLDENSFFKHYSKLSLLLDTDFSYKKEMSSLIHEIDATLGAQNEYNVNTFVDFSYCYHQSFLPHLVTLGAISIYFDIKSIDENKLKLFEINCNLLNSSSCYAEVQATHLYLGCSYAIIGKNKEATYHFITSIELAEKYNLYYNVVSQYFYFKNNFTEALNNFSLEIKEKIEGLCSMVHDLYSKFATKISFNTIYKLLPNKYYIYILFAKQGFTNKEVANNLGISESHANRIYSEIYDITGVKSKNELIDLYNESTNAPIVKD